MRVVIGVDDSPCSQAALEFVRKVSWPSGTAVTVVSSVEMPVSAYATDYAPVNMELGACLDELTKCHQQMVSRDEKVLRSAGLLVASCVLQGDPRETLIEVARTERADLVVVGSHGRTGLDRLLMGSVASHVVTHAPCSVLVVKEAEKQPQGR